MSSYQFNLVQNKAFKAIWILTPYIILLNVSIWFPFSICRAQDAAAFNISKTTSPIIVDGILNENVWVTAVKIGGFVQHYPSDTSKSVTKTDVMVTHDDKFLYVAAVCHDDLEGPYIVQSLKRDFRFANSDAFAVVIDPFGDQTNGFLFAVNPYGAQSEALVSNGGVQGASYSWDNKWFSAVVKTNKQWIVEMAIPFKTLRFKEGMDTWWINFTRTDLKRPEQSSWVQVPKNQEMSRLTFTGKMIWNSPPRKTGSNISLIPFSIVHVSNDSIGKFSANAGLTAKVAVTSSLNLDLTINPDFSQVEVDQQIINLTRFNLFFPEKRTFFIENSDLFSQYGFRQIRPFFSRRIGLLQGKEIPILAGIRLSGKANENWRVGLMSVQTEGTYLNDPGEVKDVAPSQNYSVATVQRKVFGSSYVSLVFVNRQRFDVFKVNSQDYNRVAGIDYNLSSNDGKWKGKVFYHHSFNPSIPGNAWKYQNANASWLMHNSERIFAMWNHEYVGKNYLADVGFVPRIFNYDAARDTVIRSSYWRWEPIFNYKFYPSSGNILVHGPGFYGSIYQDSALNNTEVLYSGNYNISFRNTSVMGFNVDYNSIHLQFPADVTGTGDSALPVKHYIYTSAGLGFTSDGRKKFSYNIGGGYGGFYNGTILTINGNLSYRIQPWGNFSMSFRHDKISLPAPYANTSLTLIGPKLEFSFSKQVFFTTFIQYNTQSANVNINSRFQWRFKPMSDLYIVYTDNYEQVNFANKNRALVVKFVYWFSV